MNPESTFSPPPEPARFWNRRRFLLAGSSAAMGLATAGAHLWRRYDGGLRAEVCIVPAPAYDGTLTRRLRSGLDSLGVTAGEIRGKRILLKPNLVEPYAGVGHINTHPLLVQAAAETFLSLGAASVAVAEASGHRRDSVLVVEASGLDAVLREERLPFHDLNYASCVEAPNQGRHTSLKTFMLPRVLLGADWVVSMPKLKTHHWAGVTLSMKNLFGTLPGAYYGWPKNVLHHEGIAQSVMDLTATIRPHFCIVDGILGMEGDGPIMGQPRHSGLLLMGRNPVAVDATGARLMGVDPRRIPHLSGTAGRLGPIHETNILQRGEPWAGLRHNYELPGDIPAFRGIRLAG
jgi:uncharacterized protein (DUF362 family)